MRTKLIIQALLAVSICLSLLPMARSACAQAGNPTMAPEQMMSPADMTSDERDFYRTLNDSDAKNFIVTRSYVRLCQQVMAHKLPPLALPPKPAGFRTAYLLPEDPSVIDEAMGENVKAKLTTAFEKAAPAKK
jgi:hypothetical protein